MKFAICNEFCVDWSFGDVCGLAVDAGFAGVEIAPFTLAPTINEIDPEQRRMVRKAAADHGLDIVGLHWLLARTQGMHITTPDGAVRQRTRDYYLKLIDCCADLGGTRMIHGSPEQRNIVAGDDPAEARRRLIDFFAGVADHAQQAGVVLCLEPLARTETNLVQSKDDAVSIIEAIDHPNVKLILDVKAMSDESKPIPQLIDEAKLHLRHFHANDPNLSYPGSGEMDFKPIMAALNAIEYAHWVSIEVFDFKPSPEEIAVRGLACLKAALASA